MAVNVCVQYNGGFFPGIMLLTQCYYPRGTRLNVMRDFIFAAYDVPAIFFPPDWGMLRRSKCIQIFL